MALWALFAVVTAAVVLAVVRPLLRRGAPAHSAGTTEAPDVAFYRAQIAEIASEREQGLIDTAEAEAARAEVGRRLLAVAEGGGRKAQTAGGSLSPWALFIAMPVLAIGLYAALGSPGLPGRPHVVEAQVSGKNAPIEALIAKVEDRLREHPEDGMGWDVIAPVYLSVGRYADAADAFSQAMRLLGESPKRLMGFAKASVLAGNGIVSESARKAFDKLATLDPKAPEPRYWLALAKEQDGRTAEAAAEYKSLLDGAPGDAPWRPLVEERLKALAKGEEPQMQATLEALSPEQRTMIAGMVDGLAKRLAADGHDLAGWRRLIRSYHVLGREADAKSALDKARTTFADDKKALGELGALASSLGLGS
jgi:cytochrome c-type biogenesis protein CcmH